MILAWILHYYFDKIQDVWWSEMKIRNKTIKTQKKTKTKNPKTVCHKHLAFTCIYAEIGVHNYFQGFTWPINTNTIFNKLKFNTICSILWLTQHDILLTVDEQSAIENINHIIYKQIPHCRNNGEIQSKICDSGIITLFTLA